MEQRFLGVEIGGTKQQIAVCDAQGRALELIGENVPHANGAQDILCWLEAKVGEVLARHPQVGRIGVGFGGPLETATGRVLISVQVPGWKDFELKTWFEDRFSMPTVVVNDTVAGGYAELKLGSGRDSRIFFYTNLGTGIGGSLFADGKTWDGIGFGAAYLGNTYAADWESTEPGAIARIETLCSGTAIERRLRTKGYVPRDSALMRLCGGETEKLSCRMLGQAAESGDAFALAELDRVGRTFGTGIANAVSMIGMDTVSIGGGLANLGELLIAPMRKYADQTVFISGRERFRIVQCELLDQNVPVGAALYARDGFHTL